LKAAIKIHFQLFDKWVEPNHIALIQ
jgi:hypothetical protein